MKQLLFHQLTILSKTEKKARTIPLKKGPNLIVGTNDVGKSTFVKSLYHAMGADVPQLANTYWKNARPIYCMHFSVDSDEYWVVRDEKSFGVFDSKKQLVSAYRGIARQGGVGAFFNSLLGFDVELPDKDDKLQRLWPAFYYLPFYVDQDEGWKNTWTSFSALNSIKSYRKELLDYHLGKYPQKYYDLLRKRFRLGAQRDDLAKAIESLTVVRTSFAQKKARERVDIDTSAFRSEVDVLVAEYNKTYSAQQDALIKLKRTRNDMAEIDVEIGVLERAIAELDADYDYAANPHTPDHVQCPMCGTDFENSIRERFGILDDADYCRSLIDQKRKARLDIAETLTDLDSKFELLTKQMASIDEVLTRRRNDVTFSDIIRSEGYKDILRSIDADLGEKDREKASADAAIKELRAELREFGRGEEIQEYYRARMKEYLNALNVSVLEDSDYSTQYKVIKNNALGSDLPRALLAQYFALLATMNEHNDFVHCPLIIDSPFQQEQDQTNKAAISSFIFKHSQAAPQLILATVDTESAVRQVAEQAKMNIIELTAKFGLLKSDEYRATFEWLAPMHEQTLRQGA